MKQLRCACSAVLAAALLLAVAGAAVADSGFVSPREEIPLTNTLLTGARAAGMGFVGVAVADDASALMTNPAALARLKRIEFSGGFRRESTAVDGVMAGSGYATDVSGTSFSSLRFAYPFPTFRGSLVFALGAERLYDFTADRLADYEDEIEWQEGPGDPETGVWSSREDFISDGGITALSFGGAVDVSPSIALGATVSYLTGEYARRFEWDILDVYDISDRYTDVHITEQYDSDVSGLRATVGGLFYLSEGLAMGLALDSPVSLTFDGTARERVQLVTTAPESTSVSNLTVLFSDEVTLPFSFRGGIAYSPTDLVVIGADVSYTDWSQMDYAGRITDVVEDDGMIERRTVYEEALAYGIGVEVTIPSWPLRVRGGYTSRPHAYTGLEVVSDRSYFTLGAGVLIDTVLSIDVAWLTGAHERKDEDYALEEKVDDNTLIIEAAYRF